MTKIVLLEKIHASAADPLRAEGFTEIAQVPTALKLDELKTALVDADAVGIRSATHISADVLKALPRLKAIGCFCIGTNQVDLTAAASVGVPVFNAPFPTHARWRNW